MHTYYTQCIHVIIFPVAVAITGKTLCCLCFAWSVSTFTVSSLGRVWCPFMRLTPTIYLDGIRCLPKSALLWKLSRWLLHIGPNLPVALAKPMLTVGLFHSLILKSCFGPPPTQQNTPRRPPTWSGHAITVSEVGFLWVCATLKCLISGTFIM